MLDKMPNAFETDGDVLLQCDAEKKKIALRLKRSSGLPRIGYWLPYLKFGRRARSEERSRLIAKLTPGFKGKFCSRPVWLTAQFVYKQGLNADLVMHSPDCKVKD
jgi:hypothetical protein